jgi:WD40 repeat protein
VHYRWSANGTLTEVERVPTGGAGSGTFKPISGQENAPNAFEGAASVILTPDRRFLFATNGGDNSVSSFSVDKDGRLTQLDIKPTGNPIEGKSGTAKSLAYAPSKGVLYVLHSFGPDHVRLMSVDGQGKLTARPERYTANTKDKTDRVPTMAVLSPDGKFLVVGTTFDRPIAHTGTYPDRTAHTRRSLRMRRIPTASSSSRCETTARWAQPCSRTGRPARRSTSPS